MSDKNLIVKSDVDERDRIVGVLSDEVTTGPTEQESLKDKIDQVLNTLTHHERQTIMMRYGLGEDYRFTLEEVAQIFKIPASRVRKIEAKAIRKLQHPVRSRELEGFLNTLAAEEVMTPQGRLLEAVFGPSPSRWPPSLFNYATSERCQNAFISWLIAWAADHHREADEPLHRTGVFFLNRLLGLHGFEPPAKYTELRIQKYKRIDILIRVNRDFVVLIEDKIDFTEHSNQLERYLDTIRNDFKEWKRVPIYLKTGDQLNCGAIEQAGWKCFLRPEMLEVLEYGKQQGVASDIFRDFHSRIRQMEAIARRRQWRGS